jgi:hypothetical protein
VDRVGVRDHRLPGHRHRQSSADELIGDLAGLLLDLGECLRAVQALAAGEKPDSG